MNKVAIITGASQGIGAGLVAGFLARGYRVVANARRLEAGLNAEGTVLNVPGDISQAEVAGRVVQGAIETFGRLDTLVNNAGSFLAKPFTELTAEEFSDSLNLNLGGFFHITQQAVKQMLPQGSGHVVQITTSLAEHPIQGVDAALASLTKGGLNAVTLGLAMEYANRGLRFNAVAPGVIKTPMHGPETHQFLAGLHPLKRMGEVSEVVEAVLYLESAPFITGEVLHVDGGAHAGRW
jgi:NAD(P)-dependent dehydrogenase (short-subunit alcohol dehydrogenase family)